MRTEAQRSRLTSQSGMTFIEIMIALAVLGILVTGMMSIANYTSAMTRTARLNQALATVSLEIAALLDNKGECTALLAGKDITSLPQSLTFSSSLTGSDEYQLAGISAAQLTAVQPIGANVYSATVTVAGARSGRFVGALQFTRPFAVFFVTNPASPNLVASCLTSKDPSTYCAQSGGTWNATSGTCDQCPALGGVRDGAGVCQIATP